MSIKNNLKELRTVKGMTQEQLAKKSGASYVAIRRYEEDKLDLSIAKFSTVVGIATALGCRCEDLFKDRKFKAKIRKA